VNSPISNDDLMRYLDDELQPQERLRVEAALAASTELQRELAIFRAMRADLMALPIPGRNGSSVWGTVSRRLTRPVGWVLLVAGFVLWSGYGAWVFLTSPVNPVEKLALGALGVGFLILLASTILDRLHEWKDDPYRDIER
jgi:hypothetical protein